MTMKSIHRVLTKAVLASGFWLAAGGLVARAADSVEGTKPAATQPAEPDAKPLAGEGGAPAKPDAGIRYAFPIGKKAIYEVKIRGEFLDHNETYVGYLMYVFNTFNKLKDRTNVSYYWQVAKAEYKSENTNTTTGNGLPGFLRRDRSDKKGKGSDFSVNSLGVVVENDGLETENQLPYALGLAGPLMLQPLPENGKPALKTNRSLKLAYIDRTPNRTPWAGPRWVQTTTVEIPCSEAVEYSLGEVTDGIHTIKKKYEVLSVEKIGDTPSLRFGGEGDYQFDPQKGLLTQYEMKLSQDLAAKNASVKIPIKIEVRLIDDAEVTKLQEEQIAEDKKQPADRKPVTIARSKDEDELPDGMEKTNLLGTDRGLPFLKIDKEKHRPLLGLRLTNMDFMRKKCFKTAEPLYDKPTGKDEDQSIIYARDGYAIGEIYVNTANEKVSGLAVVFMKIKPEKKSLDPKTSYHSQWFGEPGKDENSKLTADGRFIYGLYGKKGIFVTELGLVAEPAPAK